MKRLSRADADRAQSNATQSPQVPRLSSDLVDEGKSGYASVVRHRSMTAKAAATAATQAADALRVVERRLSGTQAIFRLSDGTTLQTRRFIPLGRGDLLRIAPAGVQVFAKHEPSWIDIDPVWAWNTQIQLGSERIKVFFKEIETEEEAALFEGLRRFHYRGGGGAGRTVPIIATSDVWDLPRMLGFIEISSSMIANTARKAFFDYPFFERADVSWKTWDAQASKNLSNTISRISRFVIHPELRGLGLARHFLSAAKRFSAERWHYGGRRPRFIEITAEMLRYYKFAGSDFVFMGETEGNEHRLAKDMKYLVRKALADGEGMPQGGGGIMTLQRGYASRLLKYLEQTDRSLPEIIKSLQHNPALLDQDTWEALHRLNRKPKLSYVSGLTEKANDYIELRRTLAQSSHDRSTKLPTPRAWSLSGVTVRAKSNIAQSSEARLLQDAFGFVGTDLCTELVEDLSFELHTGDVTLVCGASGSGKSLLLAASQALWDSASRCNPALDGLEVTGGASGPQPRTVSLPSLAPDQTPLEAKGRVSLEEFLETAALCGLAEPQLFVRPIRTLSSGQRYRLAVALAFLKNPDIIFIDNFCEPLDKYTAISVAKGLKRLATARGVAVIGATASYDREYLLDNIDQFVILRRGDKAIFERRGQRA